MKQKIEWYREVLELEPGSRVFFPLAGLLAADGQLHEAVITLKQGLLRHPDHVEARLLLVELLAREVPPSSDLSLEVERLGAVFAAYPGFWKAWGAALAANPTMRDAALAIRFFTAAVQGRPISWATVIESGLQAVLVEIEGKQDVTPIASLAEQARPVSVQSAGSSVIQTPEPAMTGSFAPTPDIVAEKVLPDIDFDDVSEDTEEGIPLAERAEGMELPVFAEPIVSRETIGVNPEDEEDSEEAFSLRTRSMAEVLAEQGDISGALDIYKELAAAATGEEKRSLESRAEELSRRLISGSGAEHAPADGKVSGGKEGNRLIGILESLAERLEARAR